MVLETNEVTGDGMKQEQNGIKGQENPVFDKTLRDENGASNIQEVKLVVAEDAVKEASEEEEEEEFDPWALTELKDPGIPWSELDTKGKIKRVLLDYIGKAILLLLLLYLFICSLDFLSTAFKLLGGKAAGRAFSESKLLQNPVTGLMIGVLGTVLLQSSSTTTSIVVTMVAADILVVPVAIPIVMGANIGTSVTNTIVSMGQIGDRNEFRKSFAGATVHDMFNWLSVIVFLPLEAATGFLYRLSYEIIKSLNLTTNKGAKVKLLKVITEPFTKLIIQVDKDIITDVARKISGAEEKSILKIYCKYNTVLYNKTVNEPINRTLSEGGTTAIVPENITKWVEKTTKVPDPDGKCVYLFMDVAAEWGDTVIGIIILVLALVILCVCLVLIVKLLHSLLRGRIAAAIKKVVNANFPKPFGFLTGYLAILLGAGLTILVQSSSIFTSAMTPLVGASVLHIKRMYPLTLGANIGTTATSILAALASDAEHLGVALQVALCHLFFNIFGILIWYPIPFLRIPITIAKILGNTTAKYRWFAIVYLFLMFGVLPALVFGLSVGGPWVLGGIGIPVVVIFVIIVIINGIQVKRPGILPKVLRNWNFLPLWMHSLRPMDNLMSKLLCCERYKKFNTGEDNQEITKVEGLFHDTKL